MVRPRMRDSSANISNCEDPVVIQGRFKASSVFSMGTTDARWQFNTFKKSRVSIINGFRAVIAENTFKRPCREDGYALWTRLFDGGLVVDNVFRRTGPLGAMRIEGDGSTFRGNRSRRSAGYGVHVTDAAEGNLIEENDVRRSIAYDLFDEAAPGANEYVDNIFLTSNL